MCDANVGRIVHIRQLVKPRYIAQTQIGPVCRIAAMPYPDLNYWKNAEMGIKARILKETPSVDPIEMKEFLQFTYTELKKRLSLIHI